MSYISIRVSTLRGEQKIDFNAYVKINDKMVLYLRRGDSFEGERLARLKSKKLRKMFIEDSEEPQYLTYLRRNIDSAYDANSGVSMQNRAEVVQGAQQNNVEEVFENVESEQSYNNAKDSAVKYVDFILNNDKAFSAVMNIENTDKNIAHHGVSVATLAISLAQKLGVSDSKKIQLLTLGSLLHDYGHHLEPLDLNRPVADMSPADQTIWKRHSQSGADNIRDKKHFDQLVSMIILQHEETSNGSGPLGMNERTIDPMALIVSCANTVDRMITFEGVPKKDVAKRLMVDKVGTYPLQHIQLMGEILKDM